MTNFQHHSRHVHGVLLLDKPRGPSSNHVLQEVKRIYNASRAGHTGTLDPLATGMLPICLGEATKFSQYLLNSDKLYHVVAKLGQRTSTFDMDGQVLEEREVNLNKKQLDRVLESFRGNLLQTPSMYSALKWSGKRLYEYARLGIEIQRKARPITIYELLCIRQEKMELELQIRCSKGTYIRTLIDDLGRKLGCGAHVSSLRRLTVSKYLVEQMVTLEHLQKLKREAKEKTISSTRLLDPLLLPIDSLVSDFPVVYLPFTSSVYFKNGNPVSTYIGAPHNGLVRVAENSSGNFIGMGEIDEEGCLLPHRLLANVKKKVNGSTSQTCYQ